MATYSLTYNKDDSVFRHVIVGLLADLRNKVFLMNQVEEDKRDKIDIPFLFSYTGDENFMYDYFLADRCDEEEFAIGNYDKVPRGVLNLTSMNIDSGSLTNKYVRGFYQKIENGTMKEYVAQFQYIPVLMTFDVKIWVDPKLDLFRVTEKIFKNFYKSNHFYVESGHPEEGVYRIASHYKMPEDYELKHAVTFGFEDDKRRSVNFIIEMLSFIPSYESRDEQFAGNRMFKIVNRATTKTGTKMYGINVDEIEKSEPDLKDGDIRISEFKNKDI